MKIESEQAKDVTQNQILLELENRAKGSDGGGEWGGGMGEENIYNEGVVRKRWKRVDGEGCWKGIL